jgi:NAD(P)-dependent dehydrogenase (short-subunit alcohol dehydrogenase family)
MARGPADAATGRGVIVNTASVAAFDGQIGQVGYAAAKSGIVGLTLPAARDLGVLGIRVVTIAPGVFRTDSFGVPMDDVEAHWSDRIPFPRRLGRAEEYAALVEHVCENDYLNGEVIRLDGGVRFPPK